MHGSNLMANHPRGAFLVWTRPSSSILWFVGLIVPEIGEVGLFGLKLPTHPLLRSLGAYFPHMTSPIVFTPKMTVLWRNHVVSAIQLKNRFNGMPRLWHYSPILNFPVTFASLIGASRLFWLLRRIKTLTYLLISFMLIYIYNSSMKKHVRRKNCY